MFHKKYSLQHQTQTSNSNSNNNNNYSSLSNNNNNNKFNSSKQSLSSSRFQTQKSYLSNMNLRTEASPPLTQNPIKTPLQKRQQTEPSPNSFLSKNQLTNNSQNSQKPNQNSQRPNSSGNNSTYLSKLVNLSSFHSKNGYSQQSNPSNSSKIKQHINSIASNASTQADYAQSKKNSNAFNNLKGNSGVNNSNGSIGSQSSQFDVYYQTKKYPGNSQHPTKQITLLSSGKKKQSNQDSADQKQSSSQDSRKNYSTVQNFQLGNMSNNQFYNSINNNNSKLENLNIKNNNKEQDKQEDMVSYKKTPQIKDNNQKNIMQNKQIQDQSIKCINHKEVQGEYIVYDENSQEKTYCCHQCTVEGAFMGKKILEISEKNIQYLNTQSQQQKDKVINDKDFQLTAKVVSPEAKTFGNKIKNDKRKQQNYQSTQQKEFNSKQQDQIEKNCTQQQQENSQIQIQKQQQQQQKQNVQQIDQFNDMTYNDLLKINNIQMCNLSLDKKERSGQIEDFIKNLQNVQNNCRNHLENIEKIQIKDKETVDSQIQEILDLYNQICTTLDLEKDKAIQRVMEIQNRVKFDQNKTEKKYKQGKLELKKIKNDIFQNFQNILNNMEQKFFNTIIAKYKENITQYQQTPEQLNIPTVQINLQNKQQVPKFQHEFKMALGSLLMVQQVNPSIQQSQFNSQQQQQTVNQNQQQQYQRQPNHQQQDNQNQNQNQPPVDRRQSPMYISFDGRQENINMFSNNNNNNNNNQQKQQQNYYYTQNNDTSRKQEKCLSPPKNQNGENRFDQLEPISHKKMKTEPQKSPVLLNKFESSYKPQSQLEKTNINDSKNELSHEQENFEFIKEGEGYSDLLQQKFNQQFKSKTQKNQQQQYKSNTETETEPDSVIKYINNFQSPQTNIQKESLRSSKLVRSPQNAKYLDFLDKVNNTQNQKQQYYSNIFKEHPTLSPATFKQQQPKFQPMSVNTQILKDRSNIMFNKTQQSLQFGSYLQEKEKQGNMTTDTVKKDNSQISQSLKNDEMQSKHQKQPSFQKQLFSNSPHFKN